VQDIMGKNILNMHDNIAQLEVTEDKTVNMKSTASEFSSNAQELERIMYWRNMKMNIIIGVLVVAIVGYFVMPFLK